MSLPNLLTKNFIPSGRPELVSRSHLIERLNQGLHTKLTLIAAPAGFGKTTLVTDWLNSPGGDGTSPFLVGWLSLDQDDNDPIRFLTYLISALNRIPASETQFGVKALQLIQAAQPPSPETVLTIVINEIAVIPNKIVLILDDYHLIDNQSVHDALTFLLENNPPQLHLVITTREDPPIQISRLRTRGQLNEFRAIDLRFSTAETAEFLNEIMGLDLAAKDIVALEKRTEGWVAGLHLAAISMQGQLDIDGFIKSFTGSHHFVIDYLVDEVLLQQPEHIRDFLLQTSFLNRLTGSLCDSVTGQQDGQATLEALERANLFIVPLDSERLWYRYHHLFADFLRQRLRQTKLDQEVTLHQHASEWFEINGFKDQSIEHALKAQDFNRAADLIEAKADAVWSQGEHTKLQKWLAKLPREKLLANPTLCIFHAWEQFASGQLDEAEGTLQAAENIVTKQDSASEFDLAKILGRVATIRAFLAFHRGDLDSIYVHSRQALDTLPPDDLIWRNSASVPLGDAFSLSGNLEEASRIRLETWEQSREIGNIYMDLIASMKYAITLRQIGRLDDAKDLCQQQKFLADENGLSATAEAGWILAIWGEVLSEQGDLVEGKAKASQGKRLARGGDIAILNWCNFCLIKVLFSCEEYAAAEAIIKEIEDQGLHRLPPWIMNRILAWKIRLWLVQNRVERASQWLMEKDLDTTWDPGDLQDLEYLSLARVLMAKGKPSDTLDIVDRIYEVAKERGHISLVIEVLNLQALALHAGGDTEKAMIFLERSLSLAEPGGFLRIFVDEGPPMARLLYETLSREISLEYVQKLLTAFTDVEPEGDIIDHPAASESDWIEPLTGRELEVLGLIAEGLSRQEIASQLVLSLNTVKTHARNIFSKLGVNNQMQAVGKARGLGLLDSD